MINFSFPWFLLMSLYFIYSSRIFHHDFKFLRISIESILFWFSVLGRLAFKAKSFSDTIQPLKRTTFEWNNNSIRIAKLSISYRTTICCYDRLTLDLLETLFKPVLILRFFQFLREKIITGYDFVTFAKTLFSKSCKNSHTKSHGFRTILRKAQLFFKILFLAIRKNIFLYYYWILDSISIDVYAKPPYWRRIIFIS